MQSSEASLWHRRCCHKIKRFNDKWKSAIDLAQEKAFKKYETHFGEELVNSSVILNDPAQLEKKAKESAKLESQVECGKQDPGAIVSI